MEAGDKTVAGTESPKDVIDLSADDEVVLYWHESRSWEYIRELAGDDSVESKEVLAYYRSVHNCQLQSCNFLLF